MLNYLFYINQNYSFEILRPLQEEILKQGHNLAWFSEGEEIDNSLFNANEVRLTTVKEVIEFNPRACFVPGNEIPNFIPGLKVQVFHGLEWKKKGHFIIRGYFDLYCTHGKVTTQRFEELANKHGYFDVTETGWPKLDNLFTCQPYKVDNINTETNTNKKPIILYAPTFSPSLTSAPSLFPQLSNLIKEDNFHWLIKFHPKMDNQWIENYKSLEGRNCQVVETNNISSLLKAANILISDTSSVIGEFALLGKAIITLNNSDPGEYLIDIKKPNELKNSITRALEPEPKLLTELAHYANDIHPYTDGLSAKRILNAVENILENGKKNNKKKPLNLFRNIKIRKKLNYWRL